MRKYLLCTTLVLTGCVPPGEIQRPELPSLAYTRGVHQGRFEATGIQEQVHGLENQNGAIAQRTSIRPAEAVVQDAYDPSARASYHFVKDLPPEERAQMDANAMGGGAAPIDDTFAGGMVSNMQNAPVQYGSQPVGAALPAYEVMRNSNPNVRPYQGPLHIGEPGASASLWRSQGEGSRLFRDHRAFQSMDLITIVVSENAEGKKEADTNTKKESSFLAGITELFNFTDSVVAKNPGLDPATLLQTDFNSEFTGEGDTTRKGSLQARIAAVVTEVLPNGVMRIEGEKIISVNNEEQVLVISGLVRPRDVSSNNEVMSSKIAYLRVDYFGNGMLGDAQYVGWFGRIVNSLWPF